MVKNIISFVPPPVFFFSSTQPVSEDSLHFQLLPSLAVTLESDGDSCYGLDYVKRGNVFSPSLVDVDQLI